MARYSKYDSSQKSDYSSMCIPILNNRMLEQMDHTGGSSGAQRRRLYVFENDHLWQRDDYHTNFTLKVFFMDPNALPEKKQEILQYMREWSKFCAVKFEETTNVENSQLRMTFKEGYSASVVGCHANDYDKNEGTINIDGCFLLSHSTNYLKTTVLHETGHALGMGHEHQSPEGKIEWDEDKILQDFNSKLSPKDQWTKEEIDDNIVQVYSKDKVTASAFDPYSIMAYQLRKVWIKNCTAVNQKLFTRNTILSDLDKKGVSDIYCLLK